MNWLELTVEAEPEAVEAVSELFSRLGYNGGVVVEQPLGVEARGSSTWEDMPQAWIDHSRPVKISTYLHNDDKSEATRRQIEEGLWHLAQMRQVGPLQVEERDEEDWANTWRTFYVTMRIGKRTVIKPSWLEFSPNEADIVVDLDPGMAFGTGYHPTTSLCLEALEDHVQPNTNILDLGCGSGILTIAAAKLGGPSVRLYSLDIDPLAVKATTENAARNGLQEQVTVEEGSTTLAADYGPFSLIVANLLASLLIEMAKSLYDLLEPGGTLIASGIFHERGDNVIRAFEGAGLTVTEKKQEEDWLCLISVRAQ